MREKLSRLIPIDGWSLSILLWTAMFGVALRAWRIIDFLWGTDDWSDLVWLPKSFGVDLGFALLVWVACGALLWPLKTARRSWRLLARVWALAVLGAVLFFGVANVLSFHVSGTALTLHRLRGDDGATTRDMDKFAWGDVWPVLLLTAVSLASLVALMFAARRFELWAPERRRRLAVGVLLVGMVTFSIYEVMWDGRDRGYGRHPVGVFVESVAQDLGERPPYIKEFTAPPATTESLMALLKPDAPASPAPTAPVRAAPTTKNVIVFLSEGVPLKHTSLAPGGPATTPLLKARADKEGVEFTRFYSPFHKSIQAIFALFCGEFPTPNGNSIVEVNPRIDCKELSEIMKQNGVHAGVFHGGYFSYYDKSAFLGGRGYEKFVDAPAIRVETPRPNGQKWEENAWGIDDRATVQTLLTWIDTVPHDERFAAVVIPITAHYPYSVPKDVPKPFGDNRKIDRFWNAVHFLDIVFDQLMTGLEQRQLLDDTMVVFLADHGESPHEPPRETNVDRAMYEYDVRVPFMVFQRSMFPTPQKNARLASIPDIFPTALDAMGIADVRTRQGRSILADDWSEKRVFLGAARSNVKQVGFIDGNEKFILDMNTGRNELYDLVQDPEELKDLARKDPVRMKRYTDIALTWSDQQLEHIQSWETIDQAVNAQMRLGEDFEVTATDLSGKSVVCQPTGRNHNTERRCPGFPAETFAGVTPLKIMGRNRACMMVRVPPGGGAVKMEVKDKDYFPFVTNLRFLLGPGRKATPGTVNVHVKVDNQPDQVLPITRNWRNRRQSFGAPTRSFRVEVEAKTDIAPAPICLFFGDPAFRPRKGAFDFDTPVSPGPDAGAPDIDDGERPDEGHDDGHDDLGTDTGDTPNGTGDTPNGDPPVAP